MRRSRILRFPRARLVALAVGVGALASLATAPASLAAAGTPLAGSNCQSSDGKISGRGSTLQTYALNAFTSSYASDVCGYVPAMTGAQVTANGYPGSQTGTGGGTCPGPTCVQAGTQAADPTDSTNPVFPILGTQPTWKSDWMVAYNYPTAFGSGGTGSTSGRIAISCRTDAFGGTDIPYVTNDWNDFNGAPGAFSVSKGTNGGPTGTHNTNCIPTSNGWTEAPPFTPTADTGVYTNDTGGQVMSFPVAVSAISLPAYFNGTTGCPAAATNPTLSTADVLNIWGGNYTNWNQITDSSFNFSGCNLAITRIVRQDTSGTTQGFLNYLFDADNAYNAANPSTPINTCQTSLTFANMQAGVVNSNSNTTWPSGSAPGPCSTVTPGVTSGAPALLSQLEGTTGGIGYADLSDVNNDSGHASLTAFSVQNASGAQELPNTTSGGANCSTSQDTNTPTGTGWVGLGGQWALNFGGGTSGFDDVAYANQGASDYPICSLTWDFVYSGIDGNTAIPTTTAVGGVATGGTTLSVASTAGFPTTGAGRELTVSLGGGSTESAIATYTGVSTSATTCTAGGAPCFTGVVWKASPVGGSGTIPANATVQKYGVNPEAYLTADQRRTLYSYFTYVFTDAGQASLTSAGYAALPASWLSSLRANFQQSF